MSKGIFKKSMREMLRKSFNAPSPMYVAFVLEPKRKPWIIRTYFDKPTGKYPKIDYNQLRFKRKKDAVVFMKKIHALYKKEIKKDIYKRRRKK